MNVLIAAGGTGGHLFPAEALANALRQKRYGVHLITDKRAKPFLESFPADTVHMVAASTLAGKNPVALAKMLITNFQGFVRSLLIIKKTKPDIAVGFGGYPTLAPLYAARVMNVCTLIHEANAVAGRANRQLAPFSHIATQFRDVKGFTKWRSNNVVGMPVRPAVEAAASAYVPPDGRFRLLVFGGSQGARAFADVVPPAIAALGKADRARLLITQQCRPEDLERTRTAYEEAGVEAELAPFFKDLPARMAAAHFVVCRSGAGTVAELGVIGRPAFLVPLPGALDQDQAHNAAAFVDAGAGMMADQTTLTPQHLAGELTDVMADPDWLISAAEAARTFAKPHAAAELASLAEGLWELGQ
ncbi:MAG: undecaprenyldiphospho-muramoylpentapeptide beta-N-acetylglucosaminyltransferase [Pseudomonadota bacterium]